MTNSLSKIFGRGRWGLLGSAASSSAAPARASASSTAAARLLDAAAAAAIASGASGGPPLRRLATPPIDRLGESLHHGSTAGLPASWMLMARPSKGTPYVNCFMALMASVFLRDNVGGAEDLPLLS